MSDDALTAAIAAKFESAGLDAAEDSFDVAPPSDEVDATENVDPETDDGSSATTDDTDTTTTTDTDDTESGGGEADTAEAKVEKSPEATTTKTEEAQHAAEDDLAEALGLGKPPEDSKKRAQWWKQRLPYSQVHKAVTEREKKLRESHEGALKPLNDEVTTFKTRLGEVKTVEDIILNKPEQYIRTLAAMMPDSYGKMFAPILGEGKASTEPTLPDMEDPGPEPEPDYDLGNGAKTYSVEGMRKLREWEQKVTEQKMLKRFKPHMDFMDQQRKESERVAQARAAEEQAARGKQTAQEAVADVETWEGGKENIKEIVAEAAKLDARYDAVTALNIAYRKVVVPKLKINRDKERDEIHAQILKDMKKASTKQTAAALTQSKTTSTSASGTGSMSLDDRIKAAIKRKGLN